MCATEFPIRMQVSYFWSTSNVHIFINFIMLLPDWQAMMQFIINNRTNVVTWPFYIVIAH